MKDDQNGRQPKWKMTKMEDNQKWKMTKMEEDQKERRWNTTKNYVLCKFADRVVLVDIKSSKIYNTKS